MSGFYTIIFAIILLIFFLNILLTLANDLFDKRGTLAACKVPFLQERDISRQHVEPEAFCASVRNFFTFKSSQKKNLSINIKNILRNNRVASLPVTPVYPSEDVIQ